MRVRAVRLVTVTEGATRGPGGPEVAMTIVSVKLLGSPHLLLQSV